ncbi:MAG: F0F1 ATP synthase subunit I [Legionellales bacterium]|nr:F0F1 ATP synthase subunit I [Legionellales bacterium]
MLIQLSLSAVLAVVFFAFWGEGPGWSVLAAMFCCVIPNLFFARWVFANEGARAAGKIIKSFYRGEMVKIFSTAILFVISIVYFHAQFLPFMVTYVLSQIAFWIAPWLDSKQKVTTA